jgi:DNA-directed RNA polymerase subunit RPC12/RpoP
MVGSGRLIGLVLIGLAVVILAGAGIFVFGQMNQSESQMQSGGAALTMGCALLVAALVAGFGVWFLMQGRSETTQFAEVEKEKRILNMVQTQGTVQLSTMALETNMPLEQVKAAIYDLVGKGLFTGYVDWKIGKLVSSDAAAITKSVVTDGKCPNCGAPLEVGGKGVIRCAYCGAEIFIPQP